MSIRLNWERVRSVHSQLASNGFQENTPVTFLLRMRNGQTSKADVMFKNFLRFFWALSENTDSIVENLIVQDKGGHTLYRYTLGNSFERKLPQGGSPEVIANWHALTQHEKDTYLRLIIAQINAQ